VTLIQPIIEPIQKKGVNFKLAQDYSYTWNESGKECRITVKKGFIYDGASIPSWLWGFPLMLFPTHPRIVAGATIHDVCYSSSGHINAYQYGSYEEKIDGKWEKVDRFVSKSLADKLFRQINSEAGMDRTRLEATYQAVKNFGRY
jgi:hypothetical protein